jgi:hypothetical protein
MALSVFEDKAHQPGAEDLAAAMGRAAGLWDRFILHLQEEHGPLAEEWNFAGAKYGWSMRLKLGKRIIVYLIPGTGQFLAGFVLGERAVEAVRRRDLPRDVVQAVESARAYAEGRGLRLEVRTEKDLRSIQKLAAIKLLK